MFKKVIKKRYVCIILLTILALNFCISTLTFASSDADKSNLENKLEQQEDNLKDGMGNIVPKDDNTIKNTTDTIENAKNGDFNAEKKSSQIMDFVKNFIIKSRTTAIIGYALFVVLDCLYMSTLGSRSLNKRRQGLLFLKGNTIIFLIFINIPLLIIYFQSLGANIFKISLINIMLEGISFFRENSFIMLILMAYLGVSKLIVSKNDLPTRRQGQYLIKAGVILFIVINILPLSISFIVD